jgi:hypothetical protein
VVPPQKAFFQDRERVIRLWGIRSLGRPRMPIAGKGRLATIRCVSRKIGKIADFALASFVRGINIL